ncbi:FYVE, RhoGEF and PH domain-containing protein 5b isoform 6-T6 [Tautogolabrus adspersus]
MNTECAKPSVAPKPRFVCHASLKWPSPLMSAARGSKPSIAPKPKVTLELNGNQGKCVNGSFLTTEVEVDEEHKTENGLNNAVADRLPTEKKHKAFILERQEHLERESWGAEDGEPTGVEEEEDAIQQMDEDWRLTDSALTEEVDSLETLWVSDAGLTADSEEVVEMVDTDMTEDMNAEGFDAGEALADPDGLSVEDISVNSIDEEAGCYAAKNQHMRERQERVQINETETGDCTADDLTESLTDEPDLLINDADTKVYPTDRKEKEDEPATDCGISCKTLKFGCGLKTKENGENQQNSSFYKQDCDAKRNVEVEEDPTHEPYYVSSEDIIQEEMTPKNTKLPGNYLLSAGNRVFFAEKCEESAKNGQTKCMNAEDYMELGQNGYISKNGNENLVGTDQKSQTEMSLNHLDCEPRFRLVSISVPTNTDSSLTSFLSESQLLSLNDSDVFRDEDDLEGHIIPFLGDTTDTEQDISEDHVYEEPGNSSENTSDYENVPAISSDYENLQVPQRRPVRQAPFTDFFDRPGRVMSSANETDGYVDMSSLPGFRSKTQSSEQEAESAYTEAYNVCSVALAPQNSSVGDILKETASEEDQGRTSDEEDAGSANSYDRQPDGRSRAFYIAKELVDTERLHVKALKLLQDDFREAVGAAVGDEGDPVLDEERLREILNELPDVYILHRRILNELENRIRHWEESQRIADIFLSRKAEFLVFTTYIGHYDRSMSLLDDSCQTSPAFAAIVHQFEQQSPAGEKVSLKHQLLQVIVRVAQYRMLLTDYLNNLSPDSQEYEDTQAAVAVVSDFADQANDSLKQGENLLRLVNIEYSVLGQRDLLQPGRVFVKEGTLMKVSRKSRQPRHLFLMNDVLLYTYPQQDGKYRLKNTLPLTGLKVSKPIIENAQNALRIEGTDISITLSASSFIEREDWFYTLSHTVTEHTRGSSTFNSCSGEARDCLRLALGEKAPTLVPVSQVMMCMNCTSDFSLTLRRHHCHGCGRIVCRSCSRNRYPLKYMNNRLAKVCDHCYSELKKRGGDVFLLSGDGSPRPNRSSRPLSSVFQNIHPPNIWRHRKGTASFTQVTVSEEGSISGSLQCSKKSKRSWKRLWFLLKDKVLYTYRAQEEKVASESLPLLGFTVKLPDRLQGEEEANIFQLYHKKTLYYTFKASDNCTAQRWVNAMEEATVL